MVERRKFLIGAGSLIAGGAAATGTGAFSQASSGERDITVTTSSDDNAMLQLKEAQEDGSYGQDEDFVSYDGDGEIRFDIETNGAGVNQDSTYFFDDILEIGIEGGMGSATNQGGANTGGLYEISIESADGLAFYKSGEKDKGGTVTPNDGRDPLDPIDGGTDDRVNSRAKGNNKGEERTTELRVGLRVEQDELASDLWMEVSAERTTPVR
jgi:hypothetical protein